MRLVEPWIKVEKFDGTKIMKRIERACRTCYRSEGNITDDSYKKLLNNCITRGHESVLEHEKITVRIYNDIGSYKDLTRHRFASFSVESTRYCSYDKDKYGNEISIINENISKSDHIYQDSYGDVSFLGFAHSHPGDTDFRFSINDTKNHKDFVKRCGDFLSIILNPQKEKIVCFSGTDCIQSKLILLSK